MNRLLSIIGVIAFIGVGYYLYNEDRKDFADDASEAIENVADDVGDGAEDVADEVKDAMSNRPGNSA